MAAELSILLSQILAQAIDWVELHPLLASALLLAVILASRYGRQVTGYIYAHWRQGQAALDRAESLLRECLSSHQYQQLVQQGYLEIHSQLHPGRCYQIPRKQRRVRVLVNGWPIGELCVVSLDSVPDADLVLTHKWMLESDEEGYLAIANWMAPTTR